MSRDGATGRRHVTPSDYCAGLNGDDLRITALDIPFDEGTNLLDWGSLEERDVFPFARNNIHGGTKGVRVGNFDLTEFHGHGPSLTQA